MKLTETQIALVPVLVEQLRLARRELKSVRDTAYEGAQNLSTGEIDDADDAEWIAEMDRQIEGMDGVLEAFK